MPKHPSSSCRILINFYQSLIVPYLTYGRTVWGNASKTYLDKLTILQKRALRLIHFADRKEHAIPLFVNAKILPLIFLYYESVCNLIYDVNNNIAPTDILNLFSRTSSIQFYNTRSSTSEKFYIKKSRLDVEKDAFS